MIVNPQRSLLPIAIICSLVNFFGCNATEENSCSTPEQGTCLLISDCPFISNIIKTQGIESLDVQRFLNKRNCGYVGLKSKVCCPTNNFTKTNSSNVSLLPNKCGRIQDVKFPSRIVGGENTDLDEFPWMVVIEYLNTVKNVPVYGCGGSLISKRYVLTAAHCIVSTPSHWKLTKVHLGEHNLRTNPDCMDGGTGRTICADPVTIVPVERKIPHPDFMKPLIFSNDIALLRLARDVEDTSYIHPICLPTSDATALEYLSAGWGRTEYSFGSDVKLKVNLPYFDLQQCISVYKTMGIALDTKHICAGGVEGKDTCKGDSGGPLMKLVGEVEESKRWIADGVLSFGNTPCGQRGWPGVYTKVHDYLPWILSNLEP